jgi:hypothetical protein
MIPARALTISPAVPSAALRDGRARVEKLNNSSPIKRKAATANSETTACANSRTRARTSQSGTHFEAPLWNGPRLRPAFVAQVLGQAFATAASPAQRAFYPEENIPIGLLLDTTV